MSRADIRKYGTVSLDGVCYVPAAEKPLDQEVRELLTEVYGVLWTEAYYDPINEATRKFAQPLADKMTQLNKLLGFRS